MGAVAPRAGQISWTTPVEDCDVQDKDALHLYRSKRAEWLDWLFGDEEHAISRQLDLLCWYYIVFRTIYEARRIAVARGLGSPVRNRFLFDFITTGFWTMQALGIRRLDEPKATATSRQIISLRRLVEDICRHRELFTREIFVGYDGARFNYDVHENSWEESLAATALEAGGSAARSAEVPAGGPDAWQVAKDAHETFDRLAKVEPNSRRRSDGIADDVFVKLEASLSEPAIEKVKKLCNKRIAHAADPVSRGSNLLEDISFREFERVHRTLIVASSFISEFLLFDRPLQPVPDLHPADWSEFLDSGGLDDCALTMMDDVAERLAGIRRRWSEKADRFLLGRVPPDGVARR